MIASSEGKNGFSRVAPGIWFVKGDPVKCPGDDDPTLIFLFGWMGAQEGPLAKFSAGHKRLYPHSDQIVVSSGADIVILPRFMLKQRLQPVADLCQSLGVTGNPPKEHRILTHVLSNGGVMQLDCLTEILPKSRADVEPGISAVVLDSLPGGDDIASGLHTFRVLIPNPVLRHPFFVIMLALHTINFALGRTPWRMLDGVRVAMSTSDWLPWTGRNTPCLYIYSRGDRNVPYRQVESQTEMAETEGQDVTRLVFESSRHVSHMKSDPERYWGSVQAVWSKAVSNVRYKAKL